MLDYPGSHVFLQLEASFPPRISRYAHKLTHVLSEENSENSSCAKNQTADGSEEGGNDSKWCCANRFYETSFPVYHIGRISFYTQHFSSGHSQGLKDDDLGNSLGWWAATVATYCPSRPSHRKYNETWQTRGWKALYRVYHNNRGTIW